MLYFIVFSSLLFKIYLSWEFFLLFLLNSFLTYPYSLSLSLSLLSYLSPTHVSIHEVINEAVSSWKRHFMNGLSPVMYIYMSSSCKINKCCLHIQEILFISTIYSQDKKLYRRVCSYHLIFPFLSYISLHASQILYIHTYPICWDHIIDFNSTTACMFIEIWNLVVKYL